MSVSTSTNPASSQSFTPYGANAAGLSNQQQPGVIPQGFNFGHLVQQIAGHAVQALPGIIMSVLSADPVLGPAVRQQAGGGVAPQGFGLSTPFGGFQFNSAAPQLGGGVNPQGFALSTPLGGFQISSATPQAGVSPQGINVGQLVEHAATSLLPIIFSLLEAHPQLQQLRQQTGGVTPQGFALSTPFGGFQISSATPDAGMLAPQSFLSGIGGALGHVAKQVAQQAAHGLVQQLPTLINGVLQQLSTSPPTVH
ncbi:hypothetical protein [Paracraurococcus lichenis]|uniref:Uncharacterized protein n=1 Tax=Paracraurococcus lichenis TaxID=3064888 RepID=A0ABT9E7Z0_9PROT|nr:hypothetical protein [Paracraurococcus sp. LOR1-02]MDO9712318.1 hypothetical protein [Paracraurococcus sp. LOR1-02]